MHSSDQVRQCINDCQNQRNYLMSLSDKTQDTRLKTTLIESAHHLDICIRECEFAVKAQ